MRTIWAAPHGRVRGGGFAERMVQSRNNGDVAAVLTFWKRDQRVSYAHIARPGKLSRNTVKLIATGQTQHPSRETVCKIVVGLALDPYDGSTDQEVLSSALGEMAQALGYEDLVTEWLPGTLECLLAAHVGDLERARAWLGLIREHPGVDPEAIAALAAHVPQLSAPDGPDAAPTVTGTRRSRGRRRRAASGP